MAQLELSEPIKPYRQWTWFCLTVPNQICEFVGFKKFEKVNLWVYMSRIWTFQSPTGLFRSRELLVSRIMFNDLLRTLQLFIADWNLSVNTTLFEVNYPYSVRIYCSSIFCELKKIEKGKYFTFPTASSIGELIMSELWYTKIFIRLSRIWDNYWISYILN